MTSTIKRTTPPVLLDLPQPTIRTPRLPQELTGLVMDNLLDDKPALSSSSLVCKSWLEEGSRVLFRELALKDPQDGIDDLLALVKGSERVRKNILSLSLGSLESQTVSARFPKISFDKLLQILVCLPRLHALRMFALRLVCEEVPDCLSQFRSMKLSFSQLALWNVPFCVQSAYSYLLLLSSVGEIRTLYVSSTITDWPPYKPIPEDYFKDAIPSSPLRVKIFEIELRTISPYLEWLCNLHGAAVDTDNIKIFTTLIEPLETAQHYSISSLPSVLKFAGSFHALTDINLNISFSYWAVYSDQGMHRTWYSSIRRYLDSRAARVLVSSYLPDLSSFRSLENLCIRRIFSCNHLNLVAYRYRNGLRRCWEMLVDMFRTAPWSLHTITLCFEPDLLLHDVDEWTKRNMDLMGSFLHDGTAESVSRQVYDWSLLGKLVAEHKNIKHVIFEAFPNCDPLMDEHWLRYTPSPAPVSDVWERYPNSVRVLKDALPGGIAEFKNA